MELKGDGMVNFSTSSIDREMIHRICERAFESGYVDSMMDSIMDVTACHLNGNRLNLGEFLASDDFNFAHDFNGIKAHIDRSTGKLGDCFVPRFTKQD
jgi:hypothetical protein